MDKKVLRYIVAGGCTTLVNFVSFFILRHLLNIQLNISNSISIVLAIFFAYGINKIFVFESKTRPEDTLQEFLDFIGVRLVTMLIEVGGVALLYNGLRMNDMIAKIIVQIIVLILNYVFSQAFVFGTSNSPRVQQFKAWTTKNQLHILAFGIPLVLLIAVCMIYEVEPFGHRSLVIIDGLHQYMPFFSEFQHKLQTGGSLLYSWNGGLGLNFLALWAYYLSSPLNLIIVLFPKTSLNAIVSFLIILKISLSGLAMSIYLHKSPTIRRRGTIRSWRNVSLIFSLAYALSNYVIGYSWNVMWMDSIALLPIIILGLEYLIQFHDGRLYCISLFLSLYCNFYMSFMTCIFLVIYFLLYDHKNIKAFFKKGFIFAGYSITAAGMAAVVLIPTYLGLMATSSAKLQFPEWNWYTHFVDVMTSHLAMVAPITNMQWDGGVNLYCGVLTMLLMVLYLLNRKIPLKNRIKNTIMVLFLIISFNNQFLNYIWHGFHDQYGIPNRFAFIYIFLLLKMVYQAMLYIKDYGLPFIVWGYFVCIGFLIVSYFVAKEPAPIYAYGATAALLSVYAICLSLYMEGRFSTRFLRYLLTGVVLLEFTITTIYGYANTGQIKTDKFFPNTKAMAKISKKINQEDQIQRTELAKSLMLDEVTWHNLKGVNLFGSTAIGDVVYTMGRFGFYSAANEYLYRGATPLTDSILAVKYNILRAGDSNYSNFSHKETIDKIDIYENNNTLPIGFMTKPDVVDMAYRLVNPFEVQNNFVAAAMEDPVQIFHSVPVPDPISHAGCEIDITGEGALSFTNTESLEDNIVYKIVPKEDQDLYLFISGNQIENMLIKNGETIRASEKLNSRIIPIGDVTKGIPVTISLKLKNDDNKAGNIKVMAASFDNHAFQDFYQSMIAGGLNVSSYGDTYIEGTVTAGSSGVLFTSIPYDKGWQVFVDGNKVKEEDIVGTADAFLTFPVDAGQHQIKLKYTPLGLFEGIAISLGSFLIFILTIIWHKQRDCRLLENKNIKK